MASAEERLEAQFNANYGDVLAYNVRRCDSRQDAEDVVAETFAVAWRRLRDVPEGDEARLWLFRTALLARQTGGGSFRSGVPTLRLSGFLALTLAG